MTKSLLDSFGSLKLVFTKDFLQLMRVAREMDRVYGLGHKEAQQHMQTYEELVKLFQEKYEGIKLEIKKKLEGLKLKIYINTEESLVDIYKNVASKILGVTSLGANNFQAAKADNPQEVANELVAVQDTLYVTFQEMEAGSETILIQKKEEGMEVVYEYEGVENDRSPEFQLIGYYALKKGVKQDIDVVGKGSVGFHDLLNEHEKKKWLSKFNPLMHE